MTNQKKHDELQDILQAYIDEATEPSPQTLKEWINRFPEFERELMEFAAVWGMVDTSGSSEVSVADNEKYIARGMSIVQDVLHQIGFSKALA